MRKLKTKMAKKDNYDKAKEVIKTTSFLREILSPNEFAIIIKLADSSGEIRKNIDVFIKDANTILNLPDKNSKAKLTIALQNNIKQYINFVENNIKSLPPLVNYMRLFIINNLLCQYAGIDNTLYFKYKEIGLLNDYKKIFHDFNMRMDSFIKAFYLSSKGEQINNEIILPKDIRNEAKNVHEKLSDCMINLIKYNQTLYNNKKTKEIISEVDLELNKKVRKEIVYSNEIYLQSEEIRDELDLFHFIKYNLEKIKLNSDFKSYCDNIEDFDNEEEIKNDLKNLNDNILNLENIIKRITDLINLG